MFGVLIILNNYLHDMATGVLVGSAVVMYALLRSTEENDAPAIRVIRRSYLVVGRTAVVSLVWIILGGVVRAVYFTRYEWAPAEAKGIVPALVVKHVLLFTAVAAGLFLWNSLRARMAGLEARPESSDG